MKIRALIFIVFFALIASATALEGGQEKREFVESVSTFVCPAKNGAMNGAIHFSSKEVKSAVVDRKNRALKKGKNRVVPLMEKARVVNGNAATPIVVATKSATWFGLTQCSASAGEFWFVGGSSDVTSLGYFQFINENLGKAIIDVELWSEDGSESARTLTIPARSTKNYSLTTFMPGKKLTVFHIVSRSGLIKATLFDERRKGLKTYGGDFVAPSVAPGKSIVIPGVPGAKFLKSSKLTSQKLRLFVPGESDAIIQVTYLSPTGVFAPVGLDSLRIPSQRVVEVDLDSLPKSQIFSIKVTSSEPLVAAVLTRGNFGTNGAVAELAWASSVDPSAEENLSLPEETGWLSIVSDSPKVMLITIGAGGKKKTKTVKVDSMAIWKVTKSIRQIRISSGEAPMHLAFTSGNNSGVSVSSLAPALVSALTTLPVVDSRLFIPGAS
jgi:hypothetical protein